MNRPLDPSRACKAIRFSLSGSASVILLVACNGGSGSIPIGGALSVPTSSKSFIRTEGGFDLQIVDPSTVNAQIYVSQAGQQGVPSTVNGYHAPDRTNEKRFCHIRNINRSFVTAIKIDSTGELWVPQGYSKVTSYAPNCGASGTTLSVPNGSANDIAFASNGTRYVSDSFGSGGGDVSVYPNGALSPTRELENPVVFYSTGVGVDSRDNVFESFINSSYAGGIVEYRRGRMPGKLLINLINTTLGPPTFDKSDNLIVAENALTTSTINVYAPPYNKSPRSFAAESLSYQCSLNRAETNIACADYGDNTVDIYKFPSGAYLYGFNKGLREVPAFTYGVAQYPRD